MDRWRARLRERDEIKGERETEREGIKGKRETAVRFFPGTFYLSSVQNNLTF